MHEYTDALRRLTKTFGARTVPRLRINPDGGLHACLGCEHSTTMIKANGEPWHYRCMLFAMGMLGK